MKKNIILVIILCFCIVGCDVSVPKKDNSFFCPDSRWVSTNPDMILDIDEEGECITTLNINGKDEKVAIRNGPGLRADAYLIDDSGKEEDNYDEKLFHADVEYSDDKYILKITDKKEGVLEDVDEITFERDNTIE